jgi:hypothetical protein
MGQQVGVDPLLPVTHAPDTIDDATGARRTTQQYPLHVKVQQIRGRDRVAVFKKEDDRHGTVAGPDSQNCFRGLLVHDVLCQYDDVRAIGFRGAQEVIFPRTARDDVMTARLQKRLDPGACDLVPVGDQKRGDFAPPRLGEANALWISVAVTSSHVNTQSLGVPTVQHAERRCDL